MTTSANRPPTAGAALGHCVKTDINFGDLVLVGTGGGPQGA